MIDTDFRFDKKELVPKFKDYISQYVSDDEKDYQPKSAKEVKYSKIELLSKLKKIYYWVVNESMLKLRHNYVHDDDGFNSVKNELKTYISNKIRSRKDGNVYLNIPGFITFDGSKSQYEDWVIKGRRNQDKLIRKVIDELNMFLDGTLEKQGDKPVLNDEDFVKRIVNIRNESIQRKKMLEQKMKKFNEFVISFLDENIEEMYDVADKHEEHVIKLENKKVGEIRKKFLSSVKEFKIESHIAETTFAKLKIFVINAKKDIKKQIEELEQTSEKTIEGEVE